MEHVTSAPVPESSSGEASQQPPMIGVTGQIIAGSLAEAETIRMNLARHIRMSRQEAGCLRFDVWPTDDPFIWQVDELFVDAAAYAAHKARSQASEWAELTANVTRNLTQFDAPLSVRSERPGDTPAILSLLAESFDGVAEARLVQNLRADGDLTHSLIAEAGGAILGHVVLSRLRSERPALALAPLAVAPPVQGRGIGSELVRAAIAAASGEMIVVLGDPAYYSRFGFQLVNWDSPYAGPFLQALGSNLPERAVISHAPAFSHIS